MVQLRVNNGTELIDLDLYDTDPIKLSIAIEDIESSQPISVFSKSFRLPATRKNNIFFRNVFYVDGRDYDVTIKNPASILFNGSLLKEGHIRLNKVYHNRKEDKIEYEVTFLGELRDFASILGDKPMCQLEIADLEHEYTYQNVVLSWEASHSDPTAGLLNGDVIYPLIDFGNTYDNDGTVNQTRIATSAVDSFIFTNSPGLSLNRFKPMVKVKRVLDQIFENTGFTYESEFINQYPFNNLYIAAHTSEAQVEFDPNVYSGGTFIVQLQNPRNILFLEQEPLVPATTTYIVPFDTIVRAIPATTYDAETSSFIPTADGDYTFSGSVGLTFIMPPSNSFTTYQASFEFIITVNGLVAWEGEEVIIESPNFIEGNQPPPPNFLINPNYRIDIGFNFTTIPISIQEGDEVRMCFQFGGDIYEQYLTNADFRSGSTNNSIQPTLAFDCEYKQIDFIKDLITMFKLVMAPVPNKERHFKIEPWTNYIGSGKVWDWSPKINGNKDFIIEPLYDTQSRTLELTHKAGGDYINKYHQDAYNFIYGRKKIEVDNELLTGKRDIKTNTAPIILAPVDGEPFGSNFFIPKILTYKGEAEKLQKEPIKSETRFYYYNGLRSTGGITWYINSQGGTYEKTSYPLASPYSAIDTLFSPASEVYLNWNQDVNYFNIAPIQQNIEIVSGRNLYQVFWKRYVDNLYNKWSRRVEVEVILSPTDILQLEFSDVIFIDGVYYYIDKITDMPITNNYNAVKVSLIKFNDYTLAEYKPPILCIWNENTQKWELQIINWDCEPVITPTPTPTPTIEPTPTPTPTPTPMPLYWVLNGCDPESPSYSTTIQPLVANQQYIDPISGDKWIWNNAEPTTSLLQPLNNSLQIVTGVSGCESAPTPTPTPTPSPTPLPSSCFNIFLNSMAGTGWDSSSEACAGSGSILNVCVSGSYSTLQEAAVDGKALYTNSTLTILYTADNKWYKDGTGKVFQLGNDGAMSNYTTC